MADQDAFNDILTQAYKRMHRYTCAEASLQALLTLWNLPLEEYSWATGGYLGAIMSGKTTCGLLIGSSVAIGFRCGQGKEKVPEECDDERNKAVQAVGELYSDFLEKFGSTKCKELSRTDFSKGEELGQYLATKGWKQTCDIFLDYVLRKCKSMAEEGKV
ncbi:MAG: C_GCAxxG_C_C family protein [Candidatus Heimdallarchaeota archaeon]|nr:MAG: C_GCAxxG_C_C family protein [Candidatus Heimdallarchaeota archaeon]